jgi:hypothetical protein
LAAARLLSSVAAVTDSSSSSSCSHVQLLEVLSARKQVVAGTNYILSLRMATRSGPDCTGEDVRVCSNIYVHKPLPFACSADSKDDDAGTACLRIIREGDIACYANDEIIISPEDVSPAPAVTIAIVLPPPGAENRCSLPPLRGPCRAFFPRFHYDQATKSCREFIYGGG